MSAHNDAAFLRMFLMVLGGLVLFTVIIFILANKVTGVVDGERAEDPRVVAAKAERIKPVGSVNVASATPAASAAAAPKSGADVSAAACNACHLAGVLGAPKVGDKAAWEQRMSAVGGVDGLTESAIKGKGQMPPKGGAMVSDAEIRAAVEHMLAESGVDAGVAPAPASTVETVAETVKTTGTEAMAATKEMVVAAADKAAEVVAAVMPAAAPAAAQPSADLAKGKQVYDAACFVCHLAGVAGAPKLGDKAAWEARVATGMEAMVTSALNGKGGMPPKGGRVDISDEDIVSAVAYMVEQVK